MYVVLAISLLAAVLLFVFASVALFQDWKEARNAAMKVQKSAEDAAKLVGKFSNASAKTELEPYASLDVKGTFEALGKLATGLKDVDRATRLYILSLAFLAVAGATVGLDAIGAGLGATG